jgi:hypothetical protein
MRLSGILSRFGDGSADPASDRGPINRQPRKRHTGGHLTPQRSATRSPRALHYPRTSAPLPANSFVARKNQLSSRDPPRDPSPNHGVPGQQPHVGGRPLRLRPTFAGLRLNVAGTTAAAAASAPSCLRSRSNLGAQLPSFSPRPPIVVPESLALVAVRQRELLVENVEERPRVFSFVRRGSAAMALSTLFATIGTSTAVTRYGVGRERQISLRHRASSQMRLAAPASSPRARRTARHIPRYTACAHPGGTFGQSIELLMRGLDRRAGCADQAVPMQMRAG